MMSGQRTETQATEEQWPDGLDLIFWALIAIALILVWGFWGDEVLRWFECRSMEPVERVRALISGYCSP